MEYLTNNFFQPLAQIKDISYTMLVKYIEANFQEESVVEELLLASYNAFITYGFYLDKSSRRCKRKINYHISLDCIIDQFVALEFIIKNIIYKAKLIYQNRKDNSNTTNNSKLQKMYRDVFATKDEKIIYKFIVESGLYNFQKLQKANALELPFIYLDNSNGLSNTICKNTTPSIMSKKFKPEEIDSFDLHLKIENLNFID